VWCSPIGVCNPYERNLGAWLKGNLHCHTREHSSCASVPLEAAVGKYASAGYDFLSVTDHNHLTDLEGVRDLAAGMLLLSGFEHSTNQHTLFVGERVRRLYRRRLGRALPRAGEAITVIAHPAPRTGHAYPARVLLETVGTAPTGIEIHNGHYGLPSALSRGKTPRYTQIWDEILSLGLRVWGFASDDFHDHEDFGNAFIVARTEQRSVLSLLDALRQGRFYASTGLLAQSIAGTPASLEIITKGTCLGRFIGPGGAVLHQSEGESFRWEMSDERYVRFEAEAPAGALFTQPLWRRRFDRRGWEEAPLRG
jgi:hypothetical protein